jgi:hypothetical protein
MGIWTWLHRLPSAPDQAVDDYAWISQHATQTIDTHRGWHALHVLLTGQETGGSPPASWVVLDGATRLEWTDGFGSAVVVSSPADVADIASCLERASFDALVADRYPRLFKGPGAPYVYSFEDWQTGQDMIECGFLRRVFDDVRAFYVAAARAREIVVKHRG